MFTNMGRGNSKLVGSFISSLQARAIWRLNFEPTLSFKCKWWERTIFLGVCEEGLHCLPGERGKEEEAAVGVEKTGAPRTTDEKESVGRKSPCTYDVCTKSRLAETHICNFLNVCKIIKSGNISTPIQCRRHMWMPPGTIYRIECKSFPKGRGMRSR